MQRPIRLNFIIFRIYKSWPWAGWGKFALSKKHNDRTVWTKFKLKWFKSQCLKRWTWESLQAPAFTDAALPSWLPSDSSIHEAITNALPIPRPYQSNHRLPGLFQVASGKITMSQSGFLSVPASQTCIAPKSPQGHVKTCIMGGHFWSSGRPLWWGPPVILMLLD